MKFNEFFIFLSADDSVFPIDYMQEIVKYKANSNITVFTEEVFKGYFYY